MNETIAPANKLPFWKIWILAARPKTLTATLSPVLIGSALAYAEKSFSPLMFFFTLVAGLSLQIGTNFANDLFDFLKGADTEKRIGPTRAVQAGFATPRAMQIATSIAFTFCALSSLFLIAKGGPQIALLSAVSIALGMFYTAGPFPLAYLGLGELFVFLFFGPIATAATYYLQTNHLSAQSIILGVAVGALSCCMIIVNNLRDEQEDQKAKKKTTIVRFGSFFGKAEYLFFHLLAFLLPWAFFSSLSLFILTLLLPFSVYLILHVFFAKSNVDYLPLLPKTSLYQLSYTAICIIGTLS